jgi:predicted chitinase
MARRTVYGNTWSENSWPMVDQGSCEWITVPGTKPPVSLQIQSGQPLKILRAFAADFNAYVEPLRDADSACWTPTNSVPTSNHLSGTACDLNWDSHPFRILNAGFSSAQIKTIRDLLEFYEGTIFWGNDWENPRDAMHFQLGYETYGNDHTQDFIDRKIRSDGYSTFRRDKELPQRGEAADILARAMGSGVPFERYQALLPGVLRCFREGDINTIKRRAMWIAQVGHESGGLRYQEEIADGSAYEGRTDLGNVNRGDGKRHKGRDFLQVTGRSNYTALSKWAFKRELVPSPTFFVDQPQALGTDEYAFIGTTWYWTTQRPLNDAADKGDLELATRYINGGLNGIEDRRRRYNNALALGDELMKLDAGPDDDEEQSVNFDERVESTSIFAAPGEGARWTLRQLIQSIDARAHEDLIEKHARRGDPDAIRSIALVASGKGKYRDPATVNYAIALLADISGKTSDDIRSLIQKGAV